MSTTLTIRTDDQLCEALRERAQALGKSVSEVVREILRTALAERPMAQRTAHLKGRLELADPARDDWRQEIRERNWRS